MNRSQQECRNLNQYPYEWNLPKLDTKKKNDELAAIFLGKAKCYAVVLPEWNYRNYFRIGLIRDQITGDWAKWRWTLDNSTLTSFPDAPWKTDTSGAALNQRCALAFQQTNESNVLEWHSGPCGHLDDVTHLVCESTDMSKTTTAPIAKSAKNISMTSEDEGRPKVNTGNFQWLHAAGIGIGLAALFVSCVMIGLVWYRKPRRNQSEKMENGPDNQTTSSIFSSPSRIFQNMGLYQKAGPWESIVPSGIAKE